MYGLKCPGGLFGRGGRLINVAGPAASAVVLVALVAEDEATKMLVISVVRVIGVVWMGLSMAPTSDNRGLVVVIDSVL